MSMITISLEDSDGKIIYESTDSADDLCEIISMSLKTDLISDVDPHDDTIFTGAQCMRIKEELLNLSKKIENNQRAMKTVLLLIEFCDLASKSSRRYLKFYGD